MYFPARFATKTASYAAVRRAPTSLCAMAAFCDGAHGTPSDACRLRRLATRLPRRACSANCLRNCLRIRKFREEPYNFLTLTCVRKCIGFLLDVTPPGRSRVTASTGLLRSGGRPSKTRACGARLQRRAGFAELVIAKVRDVLFTLSNFRSSFSRRWLVLRFP